MNSANTRLLQEVKDRNPIKTKYVQIKKPALKGRKRPINEEILENAVKSADIVQAMNESLWVGDKHHKTIYINPIFEKTSGYSLQDAIGKDCIFFFDDKGKKIINQHHNLRKFGRASQYEATMITKTGQKVPLLISGCPIPGGGTIGVFTNMTKIKKLAEQEKINHQVFKFSSEALVILDKNRKVKLWSNGAAKMLGYKEEEVLNKSIDIVIPEQEIESNKKLINDVLQKGFIKNIETHRKTKNGEIIDVSVSVSKVLNDENSIIGYLVIYQNITQQKRSNTELQKRFETIQEAYKEMGLQRRYLDYIYEILDCAVAETSLDSLCKLIVSALCLLTKCDASTLRLYDEKRSILKLKSCFGVSQKWLDKYQIKFENSLAQESFQQNHPLIIENIDSHPKHQGSKLLKQHRFKTMIMIPLMIKNRFLGSIGLYAEDGGRFRLIETDFLEKMGRQCSLAIFAKISTEIS